MGRDEGRREQGDEREGQGRKVGYSLVPLGESMIPGVRLEACLHDESAASLFAVMTVVAVNDDRDVTHWTDS